VKRWQRKSSTNSDRAFWLDNISRDLLASGTLRRYIADLSLTGLTSNPTIFDHAIVLLRVRFSVAGQMMSPPSTQPIRSAIATGGRRDAFGKNQVHAAAAASIKCRIIRRTSHSMGANCELMMPEPGREASRGSLRFHRNPEDNRRAQAVAIAVDLDHGLLMRRGPSSRRRRTYPSKRLPMLRFGIALS